MTETSKNKQGLGDYWRLGSKTVVSMEKATAVLSRLSLLLLLPFVIMGAVLADVLGITFSEE